MYNYKLTSNKFPKADCPKCHKPKHWQHFFDITTGEVLPNEFGRCDNIIKCGYELNPYKAKYKSNYKELPIIRPYQKPKKVNYLPDFVLIDTLANNCDTNLIKMIMQTFSKLDITEVLEQYSIGKCENYTTFPFIDIKGNIRAISLITYNVLGKRIEDLKQARNIHTYLYHKYKQAKVEIPIWLSEYLASEGKFSCLFGEHLLKLDNSKPIAIVEAPKSAIIARLIYPEFIWLATGGLSYLTQSRIEVLKGRNVYLFPDNSTENKAFNLWREKSKSFGFKCIDLLEDIAEESNRIEGYDIADYLIKYASYVQSENIEIIEKPRKNLENENIDIEFYCKSILDFEKFIESKPNLISIIKLENNEIINNLADFINTQITKINANFGHETTLKSVRYLNSIRELLALKNPELVHSPTQSDQSNTYHSKNILTQNLDFLQ
jgi:hypothetical protein